MSAQPTVGWCAPEVREEFPQLRLVVAHAHVRPRASLTGSSPPAIRERLRMLSDRWAGAQAVTVRRRAVPAAYRIFYRQIGLDPDVRRPPLELAVLDRMMRGGFPSRGLLADILTIALVDTSVPVWALDAQRLDGPLGVRVSRHGERLGERAGDGLGDGPGEGQGERPGGGLGERLGGVEVERQDAQPLAAGRLVVADASSALALLFDDPGPAHRVREDSCELALFAVQVAGVPALHVEEALWSALSALEWVAGDL
ncbi:MAG TPA: hypothetical protein VID29_08850 [Solirubrobacteraceae bacterium]